MRNFKFKRIWLLSESEQRARVESFSPKKTLLVGMNHTGKSSLIKSLFIALGASPTGDLDRWGKDTTTLVEFSLDGVVYYVIQQDKLRALFSAEGKIAFASTSATDWGERFAELIGFNLVLTDQQKELVTGDARIFFLPFYINQDGSWLSDWATFKSLKQYRNAVDSSLEYFTGVKPPQYYQLNSQKIIFQKEISELKGEEKIIRNIKAKFRKTIPLDGPKTIPEVFDQDIARLTQEITALNAEQEELRNKLVRERETAESLALQAKLAKQALGHYDADAAFLMMESHDVLVCPVCHAEHDKAFMDIFKYSEDARVLRALVNRLRDDSRRINDVMAESEASLKELDENYLRISEILEIRRGDLNFGDVVKGMGAEAAFAAFESELADLQGKLNEIILKVDALEQQLEELTNKKRSAAILKIFRNAYAAALYSLNMPVIDTKKSRLNSRPRISGSGGPRSILAYYSALWTTTLSEYGSFSVPVVIDSPQQQGQDATNLPIMIQYIANSLPSEIQVILAVEAPTQHEFDKVIEMNKPYGLLNSDDYNDVYDFVRPYVDALYAELIG